MKKYLKYIIEGTCIVLVAAIAVFVISLFDKLEVREGSDNSDVKGSWYIMPVDPIPERAPDSDEKNLCYYAEFNEDGTGLWYECEFPVKSGEREDIKKVEPRTVKSYSFSKDYGLEFICDNPLTGKDKLVRFCRKNGWSFLFGEEAKKSDEKASIVMERKEEDKVVERYLWLAER